MPATRLARRTHRSTRWWTTLLALLLITAIPTVCLLYSEAAENELVNSNQGEKQNQSPKRNQRNGKRDESIKPKLTTVSIRGQVGWMAEAIEKRIGIKSVPEASKRVVALETNDGVLHPIVEDVRGSSFRKDERLRGIPLELTVRRYDATPMIQVIQIFSLEKDGKYELDYWCDICAIAMYELKPCDCCQGIIELRRQPVPQSDQKKKR